MQALTKGQLSYLLDQLYKNKDQVIYQDTIDYLFEKYGDGYFKESSWAPFELVKENQAWNESRGKFSWIPTKQYLTFF